MLPARDRAPLERVHGVQAAVVYRSVAAGTHTGRSDIDLLVMGTTDALAQGHKNASAFMDLIKARTGKVTFFDGTVRGRGLCPSCAAKRAAALAAFLREEVLADVGYAQRVFSIPKMSPIASTRQILSCAPGCGATMPIVALITEPRVIGTILKHLAALPANAARCPSTALTAPSRVVSFDEVRKEIPIYYQRVGAAYADREEWPRKPILNVAASGTFFSDRTTAEYARDIWRVEPCLV